MKKASAPLILILVTLARLALCGDDQQQPTTTEAAEAEDECERPCSETEPGPVCAGDVVTPPLTFGSGCRLQEYNCRRHRSLEVIQKGPCEEEENEQFIFPNKITTKVPTWSKQTS